MAQNLFNITPLHFAVTRGTIGNVLILISAGANVMAQDTWLNTPLHHAARGGKTAMVQALLGAGADATAKDNDGRIPLFYAKKSGLLKGTKAYWALHDVQRNYPPVTAFATPLKMLYLTCLHQAFAGGTRQATLFIRHKPRPYDLLFDQL